MTIIRRALPLLAVFAACLARGEGLPADLLDVRLKLSADVANAYISRAKVAEDRPIQVNDLRVDFGLWKFGRLGFWHWDFSALTKRREHDYRRFLPETMWGIYWDYDWELADGWTFKNEVMVDWDLYHGERSGSSPHDYEWRLRQSLENPYLTPYWLWRCGFERCRYNYFDVGLRHRFVLFGRLGVTPAVDFEFGDGHFIELRYDGSHAAELAAVSGSLTLDWPLTENLSVHAQLKQFGIVSDDGRNSAGGCHPRDFTYFQCGVTLAF